MGALQRQAEIIAYDLLEKDGKLEDHSDEEWTEYFDRACKQLGARRSAMQNFLHDLSNKLSILDGNIRKLSDELPQKRVLTEAARYAINLLINFKRSVQEEEEVLEMVNERGPIELFFSSMALMHGVKIELNLESTTRAITLTIKPAEMMRLMDNLVENAKNAGATEVRITDKKNLWACPLYRNY